jgi:uncharacterized repeat protein (TIGR01451 family)/CSLREA domain-containing protein
MPGSPIKHLSALKRASLFIGVFALCVTLIVGLLSGSVSAVGLLSFSDLARATFSEVFAYRTAPPMNPLVAAGLPLSQNFDGLATSPTATLPTDFKVDKNTTVRTLGTYAAATTATENVDGANVASNATNGIYNFGSGTTDTGSDRALGFLSSGTATKSGNLYVQLANNSGANYSGLKISYDVEKYRNGSNPAGYSIQMYYSTDGSTWTSAGANFLTSFAADVDNGGFSPAPGSTTPVTNKILSQAVNNGADFYLAWNYSVTSGTTTTNAQAIGIDNISIVGTNTISGTVLTTNSAGTMPAGRTITLLKNGSVAGSGTTDASGNYSIPGLTLASGDKIAVFIDNATEKGATVTLSGTSDITNLNIIQNQLIVRTDNGGTITNAILGTAQGGSPDADLTAAYTVASPNLTTPAGVSLQIWSLSSYQPGGNITDGGDWTNNGVFTAGSNTVTINGTANQTIGGSNSTSFATLTIFPSTGVIVSLAVDTTVGTALNVQRGIFSQAESGTADYSLSTNTVTVSAGATWRNLGKGDLKLSGNVQNEGTTNFNGNGAACNEQVSDDIAITSSSNGVARTWSGTGTFSMTDVDVKDQTAGTGLPPVPSVIIVNSGTDSLGNTRWTFTNTCNGPYTWIGGASQDWTLPTNWSPVRATAAQTATPTTDQLIFDGNVTPTPIVTNVPSQQISTLSLVNGVGVTLKTSAPNTLTLAGVTGNDLSISAGSSLTLRDANPLAISLTAGSATNVSNSISGIRGQITFEGAAHRLLGNGTHSIIFESGSQFTTAADLVSATSFTGSPFGSGNSGDGAPATVDFKSGSVANFDSLCGDPFGVTATPVTTFFSGSVQRFYTTTAFSYSGRSYGSIVLNGSQIYDGGSGTSPLVIQNGFELELGSQLTLSSGSGGDLILFGNFEDQNTSDGKFIPLGRKVKFQGTGTQTISKAGGTESFFDVSIAQAAPGDKVQFYSSPFTLAINGQLNLSTANSLLEINGKTLTLNGTVNGSGNLKGDAAATLNVTGTGALGTLNFLSGARTLSVFTVARTTSGSVTLGNELLVDDTLNLTSGVVNMQSFTLTLNGNVTRGNGYIIGNERRFFGCNTSCSITFDVGTANGYSPVSELINLNANTTINQTIKATETQHPFITGSNALQRYWTVGAPSPGIGSADITFKYRGGAPTAGDVVGTEGNYKIFKYSGGAFTQFEPNILDTTNHTATLNGVTSFSEWTLAEVASVFPPPTLGNYPNTTLTTLSKQTTITPGAAPTDTNSISASTDSNFKGTFAVDPTTGVVYVTNAYPAGIYTVTVKAFGPNGTATKTFTLTVEHGAAACAGNSGFSDPGDVSTEDDFCFGFVTMGDFNNDGKQDLARTDVCNSVVEIYLGGGNGTFGSSILTGSNPHAIAVGDLNNDGKLDLAGINFNLNTVTIRIGNGDGTFSSAANVDVGSNPHAIAVGDFNNDGKLDFVTANDPDSTASVRLGNGDGTFSGSTNVSIGSGPVSVAVGDFNNDGKLDFAAANSTANNVSVRLGNGDGTFGASPPPDVSVGAHPTFIAVGDFNGDGKQDLAVAARDSNAVSIRMGNADGTFSGSSNFAVGTSPSSLAIADFNNDGKLDFITGHNANSAAAIRLGDGSGSFEPTAFVAMNSQGSSTSIAIGDFNNDGAQDFADQDSLSGALRVRLGGNCCPTITVNPTTLPPATENAPYTTNLTASGGTGSYEFHVTDGALPPGLTLNENGTWSGQPTALGDFTFTVSASLSSGCVGSRTYTLSVPGDTNVSMVSGNLVITDVNGGTSDDHVTIYHNGSNVVVNDGINSLAAGAGVTRINDHTLTVPLSSITGNIQVNTLAGNDQLALDFTYGNFLPSGGVSFAGGDPTTAPGDGLVIVGGGQGTVTYNYTNAHEGSVVMSNYGTVNYTGLEPILNVGTADDIIFNLPAGPNAITLADDGTSGNTNSKLSGATIEAAFFTNPTGSLTINRGDAADTLAVNALPDLTSALTFGSGAQPFSTITFNGATTLATNKNLSANAASAINLLNGTSALTTSGTGTISFTAANVTGTGNVNTSGGLIVTNTGVGSTLSGVIGGVGGLTKAAAGALVLSNTNTYTGATTINAGKLNINGSINSNATVNSGGTLGGTGTINSAKTVTVSGGTLAPGTSPGILNTGNVSFNSSSTFAVEIGGMTPGNTATNHDQLNVAGTVSLGNATLSLASFNGFTPALGQSFVIINNDDTDAITGTFNGLAEGAVIPGFLGSGFGGEISYAGGSNSNDVVITVVAPEITVEEPPGTPLSSGATDDFGNQNVGTTSAAKTFTIKNNGTSDLTGVAVTLDGTNSGDFTLDASGTASTVTPGNSTTFAVTFTPSATGSRIAAVHIASNDGDESPFDINLTGNGTFPGSLVVTKTADTDDTCLPGNCSLREAIAAANSDPDTNTITFAIPLSDDGCNSGLGPCTITLGAGGGVGQLATTQSVNINGPTAYGVVVSGADANRVLNVQAGDASILNLTISNGDVPFGGGLGTSVGADLTVTNCTISGNHASNGGGGINNDGTLTIINSTISGNSSDGGGGGIRNRGTLTFTNTTISGNSATRKGGGLLNDGIGTAHITNSTITNNRANNEDLGDCETGSCTGGGIYNNGLTLTLRNTIVAGNFNGSSPSTADDVNGEVDGSSSNNLIGNGTNMNGISNGDGNHNQVGSTGSPIHPKLGPLGNYGGPTQTHALLIGSPAIDAGDDCVVTLDACPGGNPAITTDQRGAGFSRKLDGDGANGAQVDIGAFEYAGGAGADGADLAVNTTADHDDGSCDPLSEGDCTLREAINAANASPDSNKIKFDIPTNDAGYLSAGTGVWTIRPQSTLPAIVYPVTIDGYTQRPCSSYSTDPPCSQVNTDPTCNDALLLIELSGRDILKSSNIGLNIVGGSSTVRGLVINQFASEGFGAGIRLSGNGGNTIAGNFIGTDASGTRAENDESELTANNVGIQIENCAGNTIGGAIPFDDPMPSNAAAARNVISANYDDGIQITGVSSSGNIIRGNFIGTDSSGTVIFDDTEDENPMGNVVGIEIYDGPNNVVGNSQFAGAVAGAGNVISGNQEIGVEISSGRTAGPAGNGVGSNFIGTDLTGILDLGNGGDGVQLCQDAHDNVVGGSSEDFRNVIAYNYGNGVNLLEPTLAGNVIRLNSIHDNGALGIDLADDGVTDNDSGDGDGGPNNRQNFPELTSALVDGNTITVKGSLNSTPNSFFTLDFYRNTSCNDDQSDNLGHGEGQTYLGSLTAVSTDSGGNANFTFAGTTISGSQIVTATATATLVDEDNDPQTPPLPHSDTSEFSQCRAATVTNASLSVSKSQPSPSLVVGQPSTYTITVNNSGNADATSATVTDAIPSGLDFVSATGSGWSCSLSSGIVTCTLTSGSIVSSGASTIGIVVKPQTGTAGNTVTNKYSVDPSGGANAPDPITCAHADDPTSGCGEPVASTIGAFCPSKLIVTDAGDAPDANTGDGVCETGLGNGVCTLRAAILQANALNSCGNAITINFNIPGSGVHTITPGSPLPTITHKVIINGYSQPGSSVNDQSVGDNAVLKIELTGAGAGVGADGLVLGADNCSIKGLIVNRFSGAGIKIPMSGNSIFGNFIGTDATGMLRTDVGAVPYGNNVGVLVLNGGSNLIGCTTADERNLISGNADDGVQITGMTATFNFVQGNLIGVKADGTSALGNGATGVEIYEGGLFNVIGVEPVFNIAERNRRDQSRQINQPSLQINPQVSLSGANVIAFNGDEGVLITSAPDVSNRISQNSIYSNGKLGINLKGGVEDSSGVTVNDGDDPNTAPIDPDHDDGPNHLQNFPLITAVDVASQTISGTLNSTPDTSDYVIEFFANDSCDSPSGHGEGKTYLGSVSTATDGNGDASFTLSSPLVPFLAGQVITATATDPSGNTSEFSPCSVILSVSKAQPSPSLVVGQDSTYTIKVTNSGTAPATAATVKEAIPAGLDLTSATGTDWSCVPAGPSTDPVGVVTCTFSGSLAAGGTSTIAVVVKPKTGTAGQSVTNKYSVDPAGGANAPVPATCTAADTPTAGCGVPVVSTIGAAPCPAIVVDPSSLPNGSQGIPYSQVITASGGTGSYSFAVTSGGLPNGFSLSSGGVLDGTPSTPGTFTFTITATDASSNCTGSRGYTVSICPSTFTVNANNSDVGDANQGDGVCATSGGVCTLRAAIQEANALASCGTININFSIGSSTITLTGGQLIINHDVNINGPTANSVIVTSNNASRLFTINFGKTASISNLTISGGKETGDDGGAIRNNGTLTLKEVTLSGNAAINGGAIRSDGPLVLANTTISGNSASGNGGGLYNAIAQATLTNVTLANNRSDSDDSGSEIGGGIFRASGNVLLHNTIVADNFKRTNGAVADDIGGSVDSLSSYNVIGTGSGGLINGSGHNQVGVASALLGALMNNGGPTFTHGLLYNSPALDVGDNTVTGSPLFLNVDQRGVTRPQPSAGTVDIGAYERQPTETRNAPDGQTVKVDINDVRLTFPCVPSGGCQTFRAKGGGSLQPNVQINTVDLSVIAVPSDAPTGSGPAFDVTPSSSFYDAPVTACFYLPSITNLTTFQTLRILHRQNDPGCPTAQPCLVDNGSQTDFASKTVCTMVTSFSQFVINQAAIPTAANGNVSGQIVDNLGNPVEGAAVRMSGTQNRLTVTDANGHYNFDEVETNGFYTVTPSRSNFIFSPSQRSFSALGQHTDAAFNASATGNALNPLDATEYFVRQQYLDFLNREPDESGFNFWVNNIESCRADQNCRAVKHVDTSAAFFLSIEFQQTGYLAYRTYQAAFGDLPGAPVPIKLGEFKPDTAEIGNGVVVNKSGWEAVLENNKQTFMTEFVQRPRFAAAYPTTMTPPEFVEKLFVNAGVTPSGNDRTAAINEFGSSSTSSDLAARGRALRRVAENPVLARQEFNQAFVLMQYFGYLRRDANNRPDTDFSGYNFWLAKLNAFNGNFGDAEMVKAFLVSGEYRGRFPR